MQKIFEPFAGAERLENGAILYVVEDKELNQDLLNDEDRLRAEHDRLKESNTTTLALASEEDEEEMRIALLEDMDKNQTFNEDEFNEILDKEFSVFKSGEKYDYVRDIKDAFSRTQEKSAASRILSTIPDHVFWDIKSPSESTIHQKFMNPYNPFR